METNKKPIIFIVILGVLAIAGLLFFFGQGAPADHVTLKPSQVHFTESNQVQRLQDESLLQQVPAEPTPAAPLELESKISKLSSEDRAKLDLLDSVLKTRNDNDPRIDSELKNISAELKEALYLKYDSLRDEDRNGKGFIVFLVARDMKSNEDVQFLKKVYSESPCLSMSDCKSANADSADEAGANQTSLVYPQQTALYMIEQQLTKNPALLNNPEFREGVVQILNQAMSFPVPSVHEKAQALRSKFNL